MSAINYPGGTISENDVFTTADYDMPITVSSIFSYGGNIMVAIGFAGKVTLMTGEKFVEHVTTGFYLPSGTALFVEGERFRQLNDESLITVLGVSDRKERFVSTSNASYQFMYFVRRYNMNGEVNYTVVQESYLAGLFKVTTTIVPDLPYNPNLPGTIDIILEV